VEIIMVEVALVDVAVVEEISETHQKDRQKTTTPDHSEWEEWVEDEVKNVLL
jgi:hypothetical protein